MPHFKDKNGGLFWLESAEVQAWKKTDWQQITDTEADTIRAASAPAPDRAAVIRARLASIDIESIRALRATTTATAKGRPAPAFDLGKLETLETEATALRAELATIQ